MELHYLGSKELIEGSVREGNFYALQLDDCVHRVQLQSIEDGTAQCLLLDHGQIESVSASELKILEKRFLQLPFQVSFQLQIIMSQRFQFTIKKVMQLAQLPCRAGCFLTYFVKTLMPATFIIFNLYLFSTFLNTLIRAAYFC